MTLAGCKLRAHLAGRQEAKLTVCLGLVILSIQVFGVKEDCHIGFRYIENHMEAI